MCGLLGISGPGIQTKDLQMFKQMGIVSGVRGLDSAGIFQTRTIGNSKSFQHLEGWYKTVGPFTELLDSIEADKKKYPHLITAISIDLLMGHVRAATKGEITSANAHPFDVEKYIGMHNGTLIDRRYQHASKTDSEMMFHDMDVRGIEEVLTTMDDQSAYAVTVFEKKSNTVFFATNGKRPLWFITLKDRSVTYWASELGILTYVLNRNHEKYHTADALPPHIIYRLTPSRVSLSDKYQGWTVFKKLPEWHRLEEESKRKATVEAEKASVIVKVPEKKDPQVNVHAANNQKIIQPENYGNVVAIRKQQEQKTPKVIEGTRTSSPLTVYRLKCDCGKRSLNIMQSSLCKRGIPGLPKYKALSNTFECSESCKPDPAELVRA